jgi:hypothetical protein
VGLFGEVVEGLKVDVVVGDSDVVSEEVRGSSVEVEGRSEVVYQVEVVYLSVVAVVAVVGVVDVVFELVDHGSVVDRQSDSVQLCPCHCFPPPGAASTRCETSAQIKIFHIMSNILGAKQIQK